MWTDADSGLIFARGGHASVEAIICRDATGALSPELPIDDGNPAPAVIGNPYRDESVEKSEKSPTD